MRIEYDPTCDTVYFYLGGGDVKESKENAPGVIFDYDVNDHLCGIEVRSYSTRSLDLNVLIRLSKDELVKLLTELS